MNRVDCHSHILPAFDDGSQSESQSYRMLQLEAKNGTGVVLATPHFYPDGPSPTEFVKERQLAYERLMDYVSTQEDRELPSIKQGAEVLLAVDTAYLEDLSALVIEGTRYILVEMPYDNWQEWVYESIEYIRVRQGLIPIIAHVERYVPMQRDTEQIYRLMSMDGVLGQMNTRSLEDKKSRRLCHKLIENHMVHVLGSDAHRGQHVLTLEPAYQQICKKHGQQVLENMQAQATCILQNQIIKKKNPQPFKRIIGGFYR